jgi:hypothetical protein
MSKVSDLFVEAHLSPLPESVEKISDNGVSMVYVADDLFIYKRSIPYLIENEFAFLTALADTGFVPACSRYDMYTLQMENLFGSMPITCSFTFVDSCKRFLVALEQKGIRHGDLTKPHVIVRNNEIRVLDWAESRRDGDPAPDKRPEGDEYWMNKTMEELLDE